ncbi:hypothetical protein OSB04_014960 [Centaurea solstitialis]|uniref:F-box domain-containing protein n=1 Tax=Centaurea solstitialis TaxID=347529 RepID=A0AA38TA18_9ASTR|nr:hypothetical protein OSB04_014960 [Centaurea solstitialis]
MSSSSSSDSDNDDIDLAINQIVMNNVRAAELIKELYDNNLLQDEVGETSKIPRGPRKDRGREEEHNKLVADYFAEHPVYNDVDFDRRFRMSRRLFLRIVNDLDREVDFFKQQWDARGVKGFSPLQKCASAIRQLAYGSASDAFDEYLRMSETTSMDCLEHFCKGIIFLYMRQYLRKPTATDVQAIYALHEQTHGLPGMLGSIDCMHWYWKNCPMAWRGQFHRGDHTGPSVILEAVASQDQWIWHAFFGVPGATNDIIVVNQSPIFNDLFENKALDSSFVVNNTHYNHGYYLADGIYPEWTTFVKAFRYPVEEPRVHFKTRQESARKDIERTFATLKDKWHVVKYPARVWTQRKLSLIMHTCIILHNMIREDEGFSHYPFDPTEVLPGEIETTISEEDRARNVNLVKNSERHANLRHDLSIHGSGKADVAADVAACMAVEIMKRLPVKSLIQFRSVCKAWKSLIDSSPFISDHNNVSQDHHLMIRYRPPCWQLGSEEEVKYVSFVDDDSFPQNKFAPPVPPILPSLYGSGIIDTSCGLVCLEGSLPPEGSSKTRMVVLWNPSIRKSIAIVVPDEVQSRSHRLINFGVCPETKDPKLVKISSKNDDDGNQVMVFTLSSREWRCLSSSNHLPRKSLAFGNIGQTVIGRFLYQFVFEGEFCLILSFDLTNEEFREVPVPDSLQQSFLTMSKLRESLVLIDYQERDSTTGIDVFDVWMMMEDGAFTKLFTIKDASVERILGFNKTGEPLVEIRSPDDVNSVLLAVYEPCLDHIKDLEICRPGLCFSMCSYNESLLLLDHEDGCIVSCGAVKG